MRHKRVKFSASAAHKADALIGVRQTDLCLTLIKLTEKLIAISKMVQTCNDSDRARVCGSAPKKNHERLETGPSQSRRLSCTNLGQE